MPRWSRSRAPRAAIRHDRAGRTPVETDLGAIPRPWRQPGPARGLPDPPRRPGTSPPGPAGPPVATSSRTAGTVIGHARRAARRPGSTYGLHHRRLVEVRCPHRHDRGPPDRAHRRRSRPSVEIEVDDRVVRVSNPDRVYFPDSAGDQKLDLVEYYLAVGPGIVNALFERPACCTASRRGWPGRRCTRSGCRRGAPALGGDRTAAALPRWNRTADELCVTELASVIGRSRCPRSSSTPGTVGARTPRSPTSGASTSTPGRALCDFATVQRVAQRRPRGPRRAARPASRRPAGARGSTSTSGSGREQATTAKDDAGHLAYDGG